jgi:hypothetical protein
MNGKENYICQHRGGYAAIKNDLRHLSENGVEQTSC